MAATALARAALVIAAVAAVIFFVASQRSEDQCTDAVKTLFFALRDDAPEPQLDATVMQIEDDCGGSARLVDSGAALFQQGHPGPAADVLREAVEREPDNFSAWAGLASVLVRTDPAGAAAAAARARELNPLYRPPS